MSLSSAVASPLRQAVSSCVTCSCAEEGIYRTLFKQKRLPKTKRKRNRVVDLMPVFRFEQL